MRKFTSSLCAALALAFAAGTAAPVGAAPIMAPTAPVAGENIINVQTRDQRFERNQRQRENRFERRQDRRDSRFERRQDRREARFERRGGSYYYNGHRGYRDRRAGYRQYNGYWFPPAAFIAGAIIGGAIANPPSANSSSAHVRWCQDRWRSYRVSDNSYQPLNGPRQRCVSPYSR